MMVGSRMVSVSTGRKHRHSWRDRGDGSFVSPFRPMQSGALRSLGAAVAGIAGKGSFSRRIPVVVASSFAAAIPGR